MDIRNMHWGWIIFFLVIFFPIGLILSFIKLYSSNSILRTLIILVALSAGLFLCFLGILLLFVYDDPSQLIVVPIFLIPGILFLFLAKKLDKTSFKLKIYRELIIAKGIMDIENIARQIQLPYNTVIKDLQWLISSGTLVKYNIDLNNKLVYYNNPQPQNTIRPENNVNQQSTKKVAITCTGCGANIFAEVEKVTLCEYCDTPNNA